LGDADVAPLGPGSGGDTMSFEVSTSAFGPALVVTVLAVAAAWWALRAGGPAQPATRPLRSDRGRVSARDVQRSLMMAATAEAERRAPRNVREWLADAFGWRSPEPAVTDDAAHIPWWRRLRSAFLLLVLLGLLGTGLAALIGVVVFLAGFLLELATR
ncbi:MAG TPA: hypothetical protein VF183_14385, partial [Acidimicrobiales bacterium]